VSLEIDGQEGEGSGGPALTSALDAGVEGGAAEGWRRVGKEQNVSVEALVERSGGGLARGPARGRERHTLV
jgi:hypothetical protein